eukprot:1645054-Pyramimonas_sp.AAC.1
MQQDVRRRLNQMVHIDAGRASCRSSIAERNVFASWLHGISHGGLDDERNCSWHSSRRYSGD